MFVSRGAIRPMGTTWGEELRIVAANTWWLSAFTFEDFVAFDLAYQQELNSGGGAVLDQSACLRLWVAAWLNHGNGIRKWASLAQGERSVSARSPPRWSAREWADAVAAVGRDVLQDGAPASAGRQTLGCLEFLRHCSMDLTTTAGSKRKRGGVVVTVGPPACRIWKSVLDAAFLDGLSVPTTGREFLDIVPVLDKQLCQFPRILAGHRPGRAPPPLHPGVRGPQVLLLNLQKASAGRVRRPALGGLHCRARRPQLLHGCARRLHVRRDCGDVRHEPVLLACVVLLGPMRAPGCGPGALGAPTREHPGGGRQAPGIARQGPSVERGASGNG